MPKQPSLDAQLRELLRAALKQRDRVAATAYRGALARIANASAVPIGNRPAAGAVEASAVGVGAAEGERRRLSDADVARLVAAEADEVERAASEPGTAGTAEADDFRRQAGLLRALA